MISRAESVKALGVSNDNKLTGKTHLDEISKNISPGKGALKTLMHFVSMDVAKTISDSIQYNTIIFIYPRTIHQL